jgi:hypothetical protein
MIGRHILDVRGPTGWRAAHRLVRQPLTRRTEREQWYAGAEESWDAPIDAKGDHALVLMIDRRCCSPPACTERRRGTRSFESATVKAAAYPGMAQQCAYRGKHAICSTQTPPGVSDRIADSHRSDTLTPPQRTHLPNRQLACAWRLAKFGIVSEDVAISLLSGSATAEFGGHSLGRRPVPHSGRRTSSI